MVLAGEESQQLPQNNGNNDNHDNDNEHEEEEEDYEAEEEEGSHNEDKDDDDYTPLSDSKKEKMYHNADEIKTSGMKLQSPPADCEIC
jgi:hypothetical protein